MNCKNLSRDNCLPPNCKYINGAKRKYCRNNTRNARNNLTKKVLSKKVLSKKVLSKPVLTKKVSRCKGLAKNNCFQPCRYVDTPKRQYCRISGKKNTEKVEKATNTISRFISKTISNRRLKRLASSPRASPRAPSPRAPSSRASSRAPSSRAPSPRASSRASITPYSRVSSPVHSSMPSLTSSPPTPRSRAPSSRAPSSRAPSPRASSRASSTPSSRASSPTPSSRASSPSNQIEKVNKAKGIIGKFLYKNKDKIRANFLRTVCSDSGVCITFGKESEKINDFFKFFENFDYMTNHNIITSGANGTIVKIDYEREHYKSYAILKKIKRAEADNLMYEYMVGRFFINNQYKKFPSFLQTYGFINHDDITTLKDQPIRNMNMNIADVNRGISLSCTNPNKILLLLENVSDPVTLREKIARLSLPILSSFITQELFKILFQVYYTLSVLRNVFTHYDLHPANILLYEPIAGSYIEYHYHYQGELITFKSRYIVKIIDYGRCYFSLGRFTPKKIHQKLCRIPECNKDGEVCGHDSGHTFFYTADADVRRNYYINKLANNQSHDLRLLKELNRTTPKVKISPQIDGMLKFLFTKINYNSQYGTPQMLASGLPTNINNVKDAFDAIKHAVTTLPISTVYDYLNKIGDLNVFDDGRDMDFRERV